MIIFSKAPAWQKRCWQKALLSLELFVLIGEKYHRVVNYVLICSPLIGMVEEKSGALLTSYQCKRDKKVFVLSTLHNSLRIDESDNPKKKPNTVVYYNKTKYGVDVADQMARQYSVKCASRRWPLHVFFNIIDLAIINSWILYRKITGSNISRWQFMQQLTEELTGTCKNRRNRRDESVPPPAKRRRQCFGPCNKNRTTNECSKCSRPVCGKCCSIVKTCICIECQNK